MTIEQIEKILEGEFERKEDREYWVEQLEKARIKKATIENNEKYFNEMAIYNR